MKDSIYSLFAILTLVAIFYFSKPVIKTLPLKTTIIGVVQNPINDTVKIYNKNISASSTLNHYNKFKIHLDIDSAAYFTFFHGVETTSMYINPGDQIELEIDPNAFDETISYLNSAESMFLAEKLLIRESHFSSIDNMYSLEDSLFNMFLKALEVKLLESLEKISNTSFISLEKEKLSGMIEYYQKRKEALDALPKKGDIAIDFTYPDKDGNLVSLSGFKGKNVYVDVWATWCGPCRDEIPFLAKLEEDYHDANIVFVSVSLDNDQDKQKWLNMLKDKNMTGVQLFASGWSAQITQDYAISTIPRFMLFDIYGNVIDLNAPRPSSENIRTLLSEYL